MNVFRISNFYQLSRNIYPEYVVCTTLYKLDRNLMNRMRVVPPKRELYTSSNDSGYEKKAGKFKMLHLTSKQRTSVDEVTGQVLCMIKSIRMEHLKQAPKPVFWYSATGLVPLIAPTLSFMIFGYSPFLASAQLLYGATLCSFAGGTKFGYALYEKGKHEPTWDNLSWAVVSQIIGWMSLMTPQSLGYLLVISGVAISTYIDITTVNYPVWFKAIRLAMTVPALFGLFLSFIIQLVH